MPFTLSHTATAVPLQRLLQKHGDLTAFILGTLSPDIPYYVPFILSPHGKHSWNGWLIYTIPITGACFLLYHLLLLPGLHPLLPLVLRRKLPLPTRDLDFQPVTLLKFALSAWLGALTHIVWDSFTHERAVHLHGELFGRLLMRVGGYDIYLYKVLQHGSSALGLMLVLTAVFHWYRTAPLIPISNPYRQCMRNSLRFLLLAPPICWGVYRGSMMAQGAVALDWLSRFLVQGAFAGGAALLITAVSIASFHLILYKQLR